VRVVLGGFDTEMKFIGELLENTDCEVVWATKDGARVSRSNAYDADCPSPKATDVWVECSHEDWSMLEMASFGITLVDHHKDGDVGYGRPPSEYFEASSIGQIHILLGIEPTKEARFVAAADHCLHLAYNSQCPGVAREELKDFRMAFYGDEDPFGKVQWTKREIDACPKIKINGKMVNDISKLHPRHNKWLTETSCYYGLRTFKLTRSGNGFKAFLSNLSSKDLQHFLDSQCHDFGVVVKTFGDPKRQFIGVIYSMIYGEVE